MATGFLIGVRFTHPLNYLWINVEKNAVNDYFKNIDYGKIS